MSSHFRDILKRFNLDANLPPIEKEIEMTSLGDAEYALLLAEKKFGVPEEEEENGTN